MDRPGHPLGRNPAQDFYNLNSRFPAHHFERSEAQHPKGIIMRNSQDVCSPTQCLRDSSVAASRLRGASLLRNDMQLVILANGTYLDGSGILDRVASLDW
jgi:hypothetical protein